MTVYRCKFYFLSRQLCFTLIILNDKAHPIMTFTQPLQVLFLLSLVSLVTVSWIGLLCVWSALFFYQVSVASRGLSFWRLSEDHIVNHSLEEGAGGGTVMVTPAREIKRACPGPWLMTRVLRQRESPEWGGLGSRDPLTRGRATPAHSQMPATALPPPTSPTHRPPWDR